MTVLCWIDVSRELCRARKTSVYAEAFETYVWPRHEEYREFCFSSAGPFGQATASKHQTRLVLNGERTTVTLVQQVLAAITARKDVKSIAVQPSPRAAIKPTAAVQPSARAVARSRAAQGGAGERARRGQETLSILESGGYVEPASGEWVDASAAIAECVARSEFVPASAPLAAAAAVLKPRGRTRVEVADESTMAAARRLARRGLNVVALNFASFRNPGELTYHLHNLAARARRDLHADLAALAQRSRKDPPTPLQAAAG